MKTILRGLACLFAALLMQASALAADTGGSAEEAVALVKRAVAYIKANGSEKAYAEFSNPKGQFVDRNLYIFVYDLNGVSLAIGNGNAARMVGKNLMDMRDAEGNYLIKGLVNVARTKGQGWFDYKWPNPVSKAVEQKSSYVERLDDTLVGCGIYKPAK
ncbi:MAG TPA: cache domain-containing protein [Burkholderiaceae bacterium]|nr:cache domain-containing protein [Burkholderiaceae bacterium]